MAASSNFLGLGVVFKGLDEGFTSTVDKVTKKTSLAHSTLNRLQKAADKINFEKAISSFDMLGKEMSSSQKIMKKMEKSAKSLSKEVVTVPVSSEGVKKATESTGLTVQTPFVNEELVPSKATEQVESLIKQTKTLDATFVDVAKEKDSLIGNFGKLDKKLEGTGKQINDTEKRSHTLGKSFKKLSGFMSPFAIVANLQEVAGWLKTAATGVPFDKMSLQFDDLRQRMSLVFDTKQVEQFHKATLKGMTLGVAADDAITLARGMSDFGVSAKAANELLPTMQEMVGILGMDADHVATMFGTMAGKLQQTPKDAIGLTKQFQKMGRSFGFIRPLESMPEIIKSSVDSTFMFGNAVRQQAPAMAMSIYKVAGAFSRLGYSQKEATGIAISFSEKNADMMRQLQRMSFGLEADTAVFTDLAAPIVEAIGGSESEVLSYFTKIGTDAEKMTEYLQSVYKKTEKISTLKAGRFKEQMFKLYGSDITKAVTTQGDALLEAGEKAEEQGKSLGTAEQAWQNSLKTMNNSLEVQEKIKSAMEELVRVTADLQAKQAKMASNREYINSLQEMVDKLNAADSAALKLFNDLRAGGLTDAFQKMGFPKLSKLVSDLAAWGMLFSAIIIPAFGLFSKMLKPILGFLWDISSWLFSKIPFGKLGGWIVKLPSVLLKGTKALGSFLLKGTKALGNFLLKGTEALGKFGAKIGKGIISLPSTLSKGTKALGGFGKILPKVAKGVGKLVPGLSTIIAVIEDLPDAIDDFKKGNIGEGIKTLILGKVKQGEGLNHVVNQMFKGGGIGFLLGGPIGAGIGAAIGGIVAFVQEGLSKGFGNAWDEIITSLGTFTGKVVAKLSEAFDATKNFAAKLYKSIKDIDWSGVWEGTKKGVGAVAGFWDKFATDVMNGIGNAFSGLGDFISNGLNKAFPTAMKAISDFFSKIGDSISKFIDKTPWLKKVVDWLNAPMFEGAGVEQGRQAGKDLDAVLENVTSRTGTNFMKGYEEGKKSSVEPAKGVEQIKGATEKSSVEPAKGLNQISGATEKSSVEPAKGLNQISGATEKAPESGVEKATEKIMPSTSTVAPKALTPVPSSALEVRETVRNLVPSQSQPEAPRQATGAVQPLATTSDVGLTQLTVKVIEIGNAIVTQLKVMGNDKVDVKIEGDIGKFLRVVNSRSQTAMASTGIGPG